MTTAFLQRKDIEFTAKRYLEEALSAMALGLFASLLTGLILKTLGTELLKVIPENMVCQFLIDTGQKAMDLMGAAVGVSVAWGLHAPALVLFGSAVTGMMGAAAGGPAGAFIAVAIGAELGKAVSKETKVDILVTPAVTILAGGLTALIVAPVIGGLMTGLGAMIMAATKMQPFFFGIIIAVIVGLALTAPISSAALCIMLGLSGLAAGAATAGCCAQMIGFAAVSKRDNSWGDVVAQGLGTSMIQLPNIFKNPWILLPPTLAGAVTGPLSTVVFKMTNTPIGAGMGTSGLVGQIGTLTDMGFSAETFIKILILHIIVPVFLSLFFDAILRKFGKVHKGDYSLETLK